MPRRILIVNKDPVIRQAMEQALSQEGFLVFVCSDHAEAIAFAAKTDPDLMIADLHSVDPQELVAHVHAILNRPKTNLSDDAVIRKGRITLRLDERSIVFDDRAIENLTPKEYEILKELTLSCPRVVEKRGLVLKIWGTPLEQLGRRTLDVHIQRLRSKLGPTASAYLKTVSRVGYQWLNAANA